MLSILELEKITKGKWILPPKEKNQKLCGAAFDSRTIQKEQIFFCWQGKNSDGHLYLEKLQNTSIQVAIIEKNIIKKNIVTLKPQYTFAILQVKNSLQALQQLANHIAISSKLPLFALTGSNGKTTAKSWLYHLLSAKYKLLTNYKNFNNHIGCPITLLGLKDENFILLEMGSSHKGEIQQLVDIAQPHYSLLLNIGLAHIAHFQNLENTTKEKMSIFKSQRLQNGFLPKNLTPPQNLKKYTNYGNHTPYQCQIENIDLTNQQTHCKIQFHSQQVQISVNVLAYHLQETIPMLLAVGDYFGLSLNTILQKIQSIKPIASRMEIIALSQNRWIIDDSYNANPHSVVQLLQTMALTKNYQKIAIIGNLSELEPDLQTSTQYLAKNIQGIDKIYFLGKSGKHFAKKLPLLLKKHTHNQTNNLKPVKIIFVDETELLAKLPQDFQKNTLLAFKASRSAELEKTLGKFQKQIAP